MKQDTKHEKIPQNREELMEWYYDVTRLDRQTHSNQLDYINKNLINLNGYGKLWKLVRSDIGLVIAIVTFIVSILAPYFIIKNDIALINQKLDRTIKDMETTTGSIVTITENLGKLDGRISKIEGILTKAKI